MSGDQTMFRHLEKPLACKKIELPASPTEQDIEDALVADCASGICDYVEFRYSTASKVVAQWNVQMSDFESFATKAFVEKWQTGLDAQIDALRVCSWTGPL